MLNTVKSFMMKNLNIGYLLIEVINKPIAINVSILILYSSKNFAYIYTHTTCDNALRNYSKINICTVRNNYIF